MKMTIDEMIEELHRRNWTIKHLEYDFQSMLWTLGFVRLFAGKDAEYIELKAPTLELGFRWFCGVHLGGFVKEY